MSIFHNPLLYPQDPKLREAYTSLMKDYDGLLRVFESLHLSLASLADNSPGGKVDCQEIRTVLDQSHRDFYNFLCEEHPEFKTIQVDRSP